MTFTIMQAHEIGKVFSFMGRVRRGSQTTTRGNLIGRPQPGVYVLWVAQTGLLTERTARGPPSRAPLQTNDPLEVFPEEATIQRHINIEPQNPMIAYDLVESNGIIKRVPASCKCTGKFLGCEVYDDLGNLILEVTPGPYDPPPPPKEMG